MATAKKRRPKPADVEIRVKQVVGKYQRTPAQIARHDAVRKQLEREKPSIEELMASGKVTPYAEDIAARSLAAELRKARQRKRISLSDLAEKTGITPGAISRLENGNTNPTIRTLLRYAAGVGAQLNISLR